MLLARLLRRVVRLGDITLVGPGGEVERVVASSKPRVRIAVTNPMTLWRLTLRPAFHVAESYVDGTLRIEDGDLRGLLTILMAGVGEGEASLLDRLAARLEPLADRLGDAHGFARSRSNVQYHYDLSNAFFAKLLGRTWQYSCAYFETGEEDLDTAQLAKLDHIASKLALSPGQRVLDIGCGWGKLLEHLARTQGVVGKGITLSEEQHKFATRPTQHPDLEFAIEDYRHVEGSFSRIVSVGMLEHVGRRNYSRYFGRVRDLLTEDGIALIHSIGRRGPPQPINPWIRRRIFPGAHLPSLSELVTAVEGAGLWLADVENLRLHYAETLRRWQVGLMANAAAIRAERGERFLRAWEVYLVACELAFRYSGLCVYQLVLSRRIDAVPLTRRYMFEAEEQLTGRRAPAFNLPEPEPEPSYLERPRRGARGEPVQPHAGE